jgi:hypothetical protein
MIVPTATPIRRSPHLARFLSPPDTIAKGEHVNCIFSPQSIRLRGRDCPGCSAIALATSSGAQYLPLIAVGRSVFSSRMRMRVLTLIIANRPGPPVSYTIGPKSAGLG